MKEKLQKQTQTVFLNEIKSNATKYVAGVSIIKENIKSELHKVKPINNVDISDRPYMAFAKQFKKPIQYDQVDCVSSKVIKKNVKLESTDNVEPFSNNAIDQYFVFGIKIKKHLSDSKRKPQEENEIISLLEKRVKDFRDYAELRILDPELYLNRLQDALISHFDPKDYNNSELRGHLVNMYCQIDNYYYKSDKNNIVTAVNIANAVPLKDVSHLVGYHSSLTKCSPTAVMNSIELTQARLIAISNNCPIYVTGDKDLNDTEIIKYVNGRRIIYPDSNNRQKVFDYLLPEITETGEEVIRLGDNKTKSLNFSNSDCVVERDIDSNTIEFHSYGSVSKENQIKVHKNSAKAAIKKCDKEISKAVSPERKAHLNIKKKEAEFYFETSDLSKTQVSHYIGYPVFNQKFCDSSVKKEELIPHNVVD